MSTNDDLPPLPEPAWIPSMPHMPYSHGQMQAYAREAVVAERRQWLDTVQHAATELAELDDETAQVQAAALMCLCDPHVEHCSVCLPSAWAQVPEGWQLVPKLPTHEMVRLGCPHGEVVDHYDIATAYKAMLSAAPPPKDQT